ncbi:unnamed protein product [Schistosoma curassoni]|uniref:Uncharacterized protein n=1 Tax=Schistosoma curassoni TaxID=6186 RepID=A0A183L6P1_9TREM|nr:unnamed protein product [Schistosoma curassoni]
MIIIVIVMVIIIIILTYLLIILLKIMSTFINYTFREHSHVLNSFYIFHFIYSIKIIQLLRSV